MIGHKQIFHFRFGVWIALVFLLAACPKKTNGPAEPSGNSNPEEINTEIKKEDWGIPFPNGNVAPGSFANADGIDGLTPEDQRYVNFASQCPLNAAQYDEYFQPVDISGEPTYTLITGACGNNPISRNIVNFQQTLGLGVTSIAFEAFEGFSGIGIFDLLTQLPTLPDQPQHRTVVWVQHAFNRYPDKDVYHDGLELQVLQDIGTGQFVLRGTMVEFLPSDETPSYQITTFERSELNKDSAERFDFYSAQGFALKVGRQPIDNMPGRYWASWAMRLERKEFSGTKQPVRAAWY